MDMSEAPANSSFPLNTPWPWVSTYEVLSESNLSIPNLLLTADSTASALTVALKGQKVNWILDADITSFFDEIDHEWMLMFLGHRIADRRLLGRNFWVGFNKFTSNGPK